MEKHWTLYLNPDDEWSDGALYEAQHGHDVDIVRSRDVPPRQAFLVRNTDSIVFAVDPDTRVLPPLLDDESPDDVREGWT